MDLQDTRTTLDRMLRYIEASPTAWHATAQLVERFEAEGFRHFSPGVDTLAVGDKLYTTMNGSAFFAFVIGEEPLTHGFRLVGSHTDSPALKLKPGHLRSVHGSYVLNTEIYGGPIMNSFFDTPLGLAGRVWLEGSDPLQPESRLVDPRSLRIILPSLAIHLNREVNQGVKIEPQKVMLPVLGLENDPSSDASEEAFDPIPSILKEHLGLTDDAKILSFELVTYDATPATYVGLDEALVNSPRLDNLAMVHASSEALLAAAPGHGIQGILCTDNEEIGSRTPQGADSLYIRDLLRAIVVALGGRENDLSQVLAASFMISADLAHAIHPNYAEMYDADNHPRIGGGPVIKHASGAYATDGRSAAVFRTLCDEVGVPCQDFMNRTDLRGGSTIGPITSVNIPMPTVDVGNAIWGMHALRETAAVSDHAAMIKVMRHFFSL